MYKQTLSSRLKWKWINFKSRIRMNLRGKKYKFVMWKKKIKDDFFSFLGYIPKERHKFLMETERADCNRKLREIEKENLDRLDASIRSVNMVKVKLDTPYIQFAIEGDIDKSVVTFKDEPPHHNWYSIKVGIDISRMQRIYNELSLQQNGYEYRYLVESLLEDIRRNVDALIKLEMGS